MMLDDRQSEDSDPTTALSALPQPVPPKPKLAPPPAIAPVPGSPVDGAGLVPNSTPAAPTPVPTTAPIPDAGPVPASPVPFQAGSLGTSNTANPNATPGNAFSGMKSAEGGQFGPDAGTRLDAGGIKSILGGDGKYDALADRLAANPTLYKQWQGILNNDPASVAAALGSGDADLAGIAKGYAQHNADYTAGAAGDPWRSIVAGTYQPQGTSPFLSQPDLPVMGTVPASGAPVGSPTVTPAPGAPAGAPPAPAPSPGSTSGTTSGSTATSGAAGGTTGGASNVAQTRTLPGSALTTQTLSRTPGADRFKLAMQGLEDWNKSTQPEFEADRRDTERRAAGRGQLGSGMLRTREGDLVANRDLQRTTAGNQFLRDALTGSIDDSFRDVGVAQQQQGFQQGQQESAFDQALRQAQAEDQLTNSAFGRDVTRSTWGSQGNPGDTQLALADIYGRNATRAGTAAGAAGTAAGTPAPNNDYLALLQRFLAQYGAGGGSGSGAPVDTSTP